MSRDVHDHVCDDRDQVREDAVDVVYAVVVTVVVTEVENVLEAVSDPPVVDAVEESDVIAEIDDKVLVYTWVSVDEVAETIDEVETEERIDVVNVSDEDTDVVDAIEVVELVDDAAVAELMPLSVANVSVVEPGVSVAELGGSDTKEVETTPDHLGFVGKIIEVDSVSAFASGPTETRASTARKITRTPSATLKLTENKARFIYSILLPIRAPFIHSLRVVVGSLITKMDESYSRNSRWFCV